MRNINAGLLSVLLVISSLAYAQQNAAVSFTLQEASCEINFIPSTTIADLELFAKCFVYTSIEVTAQSTLQNDQINFRNLPLIPSDHQFPTMQNTYRQEILALGEYDNFFANAKTNNLAFFEANRNSILSAGHVNFPGVPIF
jgi:type III secretory pathway component EscR